MATPANRLKSRAARDPRRCWTTERIPSSTIWRNGTPLDSAQDFASWKSGSGDLDSRFHRPITPVQMRGAGQPEGRPPITLVNCDGKRFRENLGIK